MTEGVYVLVATIPARQRSCARLLAELTKQSRPPDGVILALDGYGDTTLAPVCSLPVKAEYRSDKMSGAGQRWRVAADLAADDIIICLDDDVMLAEAPKLVAALVEAINLGGGAAAAMGHTLDGKRAPPGVRSRGELLYAAGCGLTVRAGQLTGLETLANEICQAGGINALGVLGDDDALVSAHLWKQGIRILHAATGNIFAAPGTRATSQANAHIKQRSDPDAQKRFLAKLTGWPWKVSNAGRA